MEIIRKYKRNDWWDLLIVIEQELERSPVKETFIDLLDELRWRKVESISEGASFKINAPAKDLLERFEKMMEENPSFATDEDLQEAKSIVAEITKKRKME
ncbi:hypothetical protein [Bacteriovorax sp. Seq25_V]|uniref:hypothetical protein n=1 Tax=Bacteriovorax sp. Seq25_V TaxID=1201288 RepID=UPI00038A0468|nr:hypothetical protein [Bacteriovorax sp. Seq25_V]EQC47360.1 hypothetical protein M900_1008 [Bacteriovorax sp. Seq25_V]